MANHPSSHATRCGCASTASRMATAKAPGMPFPETGSSARSSAASTAVWRCEARARIVGYSKSICRFTWHNLPPLPPFPCRIREMRRPKPPESMPKSCRPNNCPLAIKANCL
eukprot:s5433_g1.t1